MSREWVLKTLAGFGLSEAETMVYFFLAQEGPTKGKDIAKALRFYTQQVYRSLKSLRAKGMVNSTCERPARFVAVSLEKVLDHFMMAKKEQAKALRASRDELLSNWRSMIEKNSSASTTSH